MVLAQEEARRLNRNFIGTEHLLLGVLHEGEGVGAESLRRLGISLDAVRAKVEETMGAPSVAAGGSPPFTPRAKKVLELSLREALQLGHNYISTEHILLAIVREGEGVGARALVDLGVELPRVRQMVIQVVSGVPHAAGAAVGFAENVDAPMASMGLGPPSSETPPDCPHCRSPLEATARARRLEPTDESGGPSHAFVVVYCSTCGRALAFKATD